MMKIAPDYDHLTVMQKVEVFDTALQLAAGKGNDLHEVLWTKSTNSEEWLERRTKVILLQYLKKKVDNFHIFLSSLLGALP